VSSETVRTPFCDGSTYGACELLGPVPVEPAATAAAAMTPQTSSATMSVLRMKFLPLD
jgi:hypothetical protein